MFLLSVPEFIPILLAAEKIGASLICRDNTIQENVEAVAKSGAKAMIAHDYLSQQELEKYLSETDVEKLFWSKPVRPVILRISGLCTEEPEERYSSESAHGSAVISWEDFLMMGDSYTGIVEAPVDIHRPLFRAYTSGSTGPSKQVTHSAHTMLSVVAQMNFMPEEMASDQIC